MFWLARLFQNDYIIPIWNWSVYRFMYCIWHFCNYIIPIWNWSFYNTNRLRMVLLITLFLYGIGAFIIIHSFFVLFFITLFLYGIGANSNHSTVRNYILRLHYSYMELELNYNRIYSPNFFSLHYSYMELEPIFDFVH